MATITLRAYWGKWLDFQLDHDELIVLQSYLQRNRTMPVSVGAWLFRWSGDVLYFSNGESADRYYIDMPLGDVLTVLSKAIQEHTKDT